jgi:hypothetical protein
MKMKSVHQREEISKVLAKLNLLSTELAHTHVVVDEIIYDGYIYRCDDQHKQQQFIQAISSSNNSNSCQ